MECEGLGPAGSGSEECNLKGSLGLLLAWRARGPNIQRGAQKQKKKQKNRPTENPPENYSAGRVRFFEYFGGFSVGQLKNNLLFFAGHPEGYCKCWPKHGGPRRLIVQILSRPFPPSPHSKSPLWVFPSSNGHIPRQFSPNNYPPPFPRLGQHLQYAVTLSCPWDRLGLVIPEVYLKDT